MKRNILVVPFIIFNVLTATFKETLYNSLVANYKRPITILYLTNQPNPLPISKKDVVVIWSQNESIKHHLECKNAKNYLLICGEIEKTNLLKLSECEHFDIAIIDISLTPTLFLKDAHLADYTIFTDMALHELGTNINDDFILFHNPKKELPKNWWGSHSAHKDYIIESNFHSKFLIKPETCTVAKKIKKCSWMPGINLYTFCNLNGQFPSLDYVRTSVLEIFNPLTHKDFGAANIIIQGKKLKAIDYTDTIYGENPYERLRRTIELQLNMKYQE